MKLLVLLVLCAAWTWALPLEEENSHPSAVFFRDTKSSSRGLTRIVGGQPAYVGEFPWQAAIYIQETLAVQFCAGALISNGWILTAAHCVEGAISISVTLGVVALSGNTPGSLVADVSGIVIHQDYSAIDITNDIALLKLSQDVEYSENIQAIALGSGAVGGGVAVTVSGWGRTSDNSGGLSAALNHVTLTSITNEDCRRVYGSAVGSGVLCAQGVGVQSTCNGDSGSPLVVNYGANPLILVGLVSFGSSAGCEQTHPVGFTRIATYRTWILANSGV